MLDATTYSLVGRSRGMAGTPSVLPVQLTLTPKFVSEPAAFRLRLIPKVTSIAPA